MPQPAVIEDFERDLVIERRVSQRLIQERDALRKILDRINELACYASEENTKARASVLLEIGKLARSSVDRGGEPHG